MNCSRAAKPAEARSSSAARRASSRRGVREPNENGPFCTDRSSSMDSVRSIGRDAGRLPRVPLAHATARKAALALATQRKIRLLSGGKRRRMAFDLGGRENLTEAQQQLIRRCAMISAYPARHRNSRPDAPRVTGNGHPPAGCDCRGSGADRLAMWSPSFAVPVRAPKRWWCRECKAPITDERGLVEMPCGFCLDDKAEAKARMTSSDEAAARNFSSWAAFTFEKVAPAT